jgi:hypothetical protein
MYKKKTHIETKFELILIRIEKKRNFEKITEKKTKTFFYNLDNDFEIVFFMINKLWI